MTTYWMTLTLKSDGAFGRGDGVAGVVNAEVQHDEVGLPYLGGKTLKGLLTATCGEIIHGLRQSNALNGWETAAQNLFGAPGSEAEDEASLHVGDARLPADLGAALADEMEHNQLSREAVLETLTALRRQTAMDAITGAPQRETLRTIRVILRETTFTARLDFLSKPTEIDLALLAACVRGLRRAGSNRNRGFGRVTCALYDRQPGEGVQPVTETHFARFRKEISSS